MSARVASTSVMSARVASTSVMSIRVAESAVPSSSIAPAVGVTVAIIVFLIFGVFAIFVVAFFIISKTRSRHQRYIIKMISITITFPCTATNITNTMMSLTKK